ncbi:tRNA (adenosine(37)-N6)-threonylcarbamoyltransferase complex dimerization subunit type 1 TsaB [Sphingobacterium faecale]|uniref:tRNA (Adenosine(37)-N6)-threonylcarbamoyltransferase complex dimerization subunit type 1 TsaB n=1 Tax=Sphingobacterium faecale TaxID=2803775 RepID=A0ABS1R983_9SPHI|nr:tRNA (adenosine(37)-N6)-threonylcarbamoyltransferase complex dimerization subunit type 1 TsaB [Sphingobacterium faecale]MBL1411271.1 tRNA (adenosine(37)-N6)-threonylcarbamoyltransferase complex dimerization subunit type 1 TsaB [Sphingobacterium faecale]
MRNYILQIDTATEVCSVSLSNDGKLIAELTAEDKNMHASGLTVCIDRLLKSVSLDYTDLSAVAVSMGPGSYTGLRIGVSTAKGLCYALDVPLIGVNTLESMYEGYITMSEVQDNLVYIPMLDARRMEVYMAVFDNQKNCLQKTEAVIVDAGTFDIFAPKNVVLFGSGANKFQELFEGNTQVKIDTEYQHSSAYLSTIAFRKFQNKEVEDLIYFEPFYLKEFVATVSKKLI